MIHGAIGEQPGWSIGVDAALTHHVKDAVGLVQNQDLQLGTVEAWCLVHVLQQPPRCAHQHVHACTSTTPHLNLPPRLHQMLCVLFISCSSSQMCSQACPCQQRTTKPHFACLFTRDLLSYTKAATQVRLWKRQKNLREWCCG